MNAAAAGWFPDPAGRHEHRWWDGTQWTEYVGDQGRSSTDPLSAPTPATGERPDPTAVAHLRRLVLDSLTNELQMDQEWVTRTDTQLRWWGGPTPLTIDVSDAQLTYGDPTIKVRCEVTLARDVTAPSATVLSLATAANTMASFGAIVWLEQERRLIAFTTFYAHIGSLSIMQLLPSAVLLTYTEALGKITGGIAALVGGLDDSTPHPTSGTRRDLDEILGVTDTLVIPHGMATSSSWSEEDFSQIGVTMSAIGMFATTGNGLTVEFPYTSDVPASMQAALGIPDVGMTALYEQRTDMPHPGYGSGLFCLLRLPDPADPATDPVTTNLLNEDSYRSFTTTASWGAWCTNERGVCHVLFVPELFYRPGIADNFALYAAAHTRRAKAILHPGDNTGGNGDAAIRPQDNRRADSTFGHQATNAISHLRGSLPKLLGQHRNAGHPAHPGPVPITAQARRGLPHRTMTTDEAYGIEGIAYWTAWRWNLDVVGESYHRAALRAVMGIDPSTRHGMWIGTATLVPEPSNPHDPNAVAVVIDGHHVGYIPRELAPSVLQVVGRKPFEVPAKIEGSSQGDDYGVELVVPGFDGHSSKATTKWAKWAPRGVPPTGRWTCGACGHRWSSPERADIHYWRKHNGPHVCPGCGGYTHSHPEPAQVR